MAGVALVAVLPEFVVEVYFAFSGQVELSDRSLTGSTRLLLSVAVGMPAIASVVLGRSGRAPPTGGRVRARRRVDLAVVLAASLYAPLVVLRGHLAWPDAVVLLGLYALPAPRVVRLARGPAPRGRRRRTGELPSASGAAGCGTSSSSPLARSWSRQTIANAVMLTGTTVGVGPYLLVQSLVPLAAECPSSSWPSC